MIRNIVVISVLLAIIGAKYGIAQDLITFQSTCADQTSASAPLRQTIVIIDESIVRGGKKADQANLVWTRPLLQIADVAERVPHGNMLPHERLSVFVARRNGAEITPEFVGCSPNVSLIQRRKLEENSSTLDWVFNGGPTREIEKSRDGFKDALADAIGGITREAPTDQASPQPGAFLRALTSSTRIVDLSAGIPRVLLISPLELVDHKEWGSAEDAREAGFQLSTQTGLDLQRAETYVIAPHSSADGNLRPFVEAFLLGSRAIVVGWRSEGLPQLLPAPADVKVFGGTVQIDTVPAPVQIRVATDKQGTLVNSWIEVTTGRSLATPISGKAICSVMDACDIKGDGTLMAQAWNPQLGEKFRPKFAWYGLRYFEMTYHGLEGSVRIWDPHVVIHIRDREIEEFRFPVKLTAKQEF